MIRPKRVTPCLLLTIIAAAAWEWDAQEAGGIEPPVEAVEFASQVVFRSARPPGYAAWVSFFPGENGQWYIGCEEVSRPKQPLPPTSPEQWYGMGLPAGYDKSQYQMEALLLESADKLKSWKVISREPYRHQHSVHQFASARTKEGHFLRFNWACYSLNRAVRTNEILRESRDDGKTWQTVTPFLSDRFAYYPHRLRTLRDGTLVLCLPIAPRWGEGADRPIRHCMRLDTNNEMRMSLLFSFDQGRTWQGPLSILDGVNVSETDFVELPDGHLLFVNNHIFAKYGRQFVYRDGPRFIPGPLEFARSDEVPETVCLTQEGILVGCHRPGRYYWSDDLGQTWNRLAGVPDRGPEVYQPWIHALPDGRIACAGHYGYDDPISEGRRKENYINLHTFHLRVNRKSKDINVHVQRDYDEGRKRWLNRFTVSLTQDGQPLPGKELELWYVERSKPGYDSANATPLANRMKAGGTILRPKTDATGKAHVVLPGRFDEITDPHLSYQLVVRFNMKRADADYKSFQTPQFEFYAFAPLPTELKPSERGQ